MKVVAGVGPVALLLKEEGAVPSDEPLVVIAAEAWGAVAAADSVVGAVATGGSVVAVAATGGSVSVAGAAASGLAALGVAAASSGIDPRLSATVNGSSFVTASLGVGVLLGDSTGRYSGGPKAENGTAGVGVGALSEMTVLSE